VEGYALANVGETHLDRGELDLARDRLLAAIERLGKSGIAEMLATAHGMLAEVERSAGAFHLARAHYDKAAAGLERAGSPMHHAITLAFRATFAADEGRLDEARQDMARATSLAATLEDAIAAEALELTREHLAVVEAREPAAIASGRSHLDRVRRAEPGARSAVEKSDLIRFAARRLEAALVRAERAAPA
jgi:hypothetical protein